VYLQDYSKLLLILPSVCRVQNSCHWKYGSDTGKILHLRYTYCPNYSDNEQKHLPYDSQNKLLYTNIIKKPNADTPDIVRTLLQ
jgi:hypothetical protein